MKTKLLGILLLTACGQQPVAQEQLAAQDTSSKKQATTKPTVMKTSEGNDLIVTSSHFALNESELPVCDSSRDGFLYFLSDTKTFKGCDGFAWQEIDTRGERGEQGIAGRDGSDGQDGQDGTNGTDGVGTQGPQGIQGIQGVAGTNGTNGTNGIGTNGTNGTNGVDGQNGTPWKVYSQAGTALAFYLNTVSFSDTQYNESGKEHNVYGLIVRSLTANEYTVYKTSFSDTGSAALPDNGQGFWPNPVRYRLHATDVNNTRIYFTGSNCTGVEHIRVSSGGADANNSTQIASSAVSALALFPNMWILTGEGNYEVKIVQTTSYPSGTASSVITPSGCVNISAASSSYREVTHRAPQFAASLGLGWYINE